MASLLLELFVEELPPKALKRLGEVFAETLTGSLRTQGLANADSTHTAYASPRRLAVHLSKVLAQAPDKPVSQKLMPVSVGLDAEGRATPALLKKLAASGADASAVAKLRRAVDGKAETLFYDSVAQGALLAAGLQQALEAAIAALPIPKVMTYQLADGWDTVNFVRPAHGLVTLHGAEIVPIGLLGLTAGRTTHGHRFEAQLDPIVIRDADSYETQMENEGAVIPSFEKRRAAIAHQLQAAAAAAGEHLQPIRDEALLDEVTALVERPNVLIGQFEEAFLEVPQECLILTMKANQKYFPLLNPHGRLTNRFLLVSNISPADPSAVISGNERVIRPRLADAKFFFDQDRKKTLASRLPSLAKVVYHGKLGTQGERVVRVAAIARAIGEKLAGPLAISGLAERADIAAGLAKADLLTDMVGEFPELQGVMGRYYALHDGYADDIADAIEDHYKPRFAGDDLPRNAVGTVVALADKLETLVGLFGIGQLPSGDRDPFALRRHALGVIRMLIEHELPLDLDRLLATVFEFVDTSESIALSGGMPKTKPGEAAPATLDTEAPAKVGEFIFERLAGLLREQGYSAQEIDAVLSLRPQRLADIPKRLTAVRAFNALPEAASLAAANKRVGNILKKVADDVVAGVDAKLLVEAAETALDQALQRVRPQAEQAYASGDYAAALQALAALKQPVDAFFDGVMVNAEDPALRANRLGLLATLHQAMNRIADLSRLAG